MPLFRRSYPSSIRQTPMGPSARFRPICSPSCHLMIKRCWRCLALTQPCQRSIAQEICEAFYTLFLFLPLILFHHFLCWRIMWLFIVFNNVSVSAFVFASLCRRGLKN
ncbi:hypothetical protein BDV25DRAFT_89304 [Aspergillus avenaceus]|uniref:Uncharacterized protein n=1 Tax=Aspergillus avenaceus TaxID=36643 RepID=A0A5N6TZB6_ASPAV|nr:hypothetical protein BDV25DRAFT_89304 [Aspergillus avenaceus]